MKKTIASALAVLLASLGFVIVDKSWTDRVEVLESQVINLQQHTVDGDATTARETTVIPTEIFETTVAPTNVLEISLDSSMTVGSKKTVANLPYTETCTQYSYSSIYGQRYISGSETAVITVNSFFVEVTEMNPILEYDPDYRNPLIVKVSLSGTIEAPSYPYVGSVSIGINDYWDGNALSDLPRKTRCLTDENGNFELYAHYAVDYDTVITANVYVFKPNEYESITNYSASLPPSTASSRAFNS